MCSLRLRPSVDAYDGVILHLCRVLSTRTTHNVNLRRKRGSNYQHLLVPEFHSSLDPLIHEKLGINTGRCALGPGAQSEVNTVLGRAMRLIYMNVGHTYLHQHARVPFGRFMASKEPAAFRASHPDLQWLWDSPATLMPALETPDCFEIVVAGGLGGARSTYSYGAAEPVSRLIEP